ncbi:MAG TPA: DUF4332 domain-containing protein [Longimicrobiales bacterium]|nr:DUF4332 domain-containing protein [Longimicrobiales bacterium]
MASTASPYVANSTVSATAGLDPGWWRLPLLAVVSGVAMLTIATSLLLSGVEPFATWYYNFAWYPVLLAGDGLVALTGGAGRGKRGEFLLLGKWSFLATVLAWSSVVWLFYELFNFRLQNWYYVFLPPDRLSRWSGTMLAFATVLPAVFVAEAILNGWHVAEKVRWPQFRVTKAVIMGMRVSGVIMLALVMIWPKYFFPLVWGATMLLVEPENYKRSHAHSLLADLERGEPGRLLRLLIGGALIGFTWEMLNINARGKWIYTVPGVEELKIFEMPVPGFFGFPPFAVECFILWQTLVLAGVAIPRWGAARAASTRKRVMAAIGAVVFSVGVLWAMEYLTVDSYTPRLADIPNVPGEKLASAGFDVFSLAKSRASDVARVTNDAAVATSWIEYARLASLRGLGTEYLTLLGQLGIHSIDDLAAQQPADLTTRLEELTGHDLVDARVRVWVRGARRMQRTATGQLSRN